MAISGNTLLVGNADGTRRGRALFVTLGDDFPVPRPADDDRKRARTAD